jgi:hypothetical protein
LIKFHVDAARASPVVTWVNVDAVSAKLASVTQSKVGAEVAPDSLPVPSIAPEQSQDPEPVPAASVAPRTVPNATDEQPELEPAPMPVKSDETVPMAQSKRVRKVKTRKRKPQSVPEASAESGVTPPVSASEPADQPAVISAPQSMRVSPPHGATGGYTNGLQRALFDKEQIVELSGCVYCGRLCHAEDGSKPVRVDHCDEITWNDGQAGLRLRKVVGHVACSNRWRAAVKAQIDRGPGMSPVTRQ